MEVLAVSLIAYLVFAPVFGIVAFFRRDRLQDELAGLRRQIEALRNQVASQSRPAPEPETPHIAQPVAPPPEAPKPEATKPRAPKPEAAVAPPVSQLPQRPRQASPWQSALKHLEAELTGRWLVWLGGLALALAAVFLVKHSIDRGWLNAQARVTLGFGGGLALIGLGEWLRRHPVQQALQALRHDFVPAALVAAGVAAAFASLYAAYGLYSLIGPALAFALLAAVASLAVGLSLLHGRLVAVLGLLGAFTTPALVSVTTPSPWALFPYLTLVVGGLVGVQRARGWWSLGWPTLAGAAIWPLLWFVTAWHRPDQLPIGLYLLAVSAFFYWPVRWPPDEVARKPARPGWRGLIQPPADPAGRLFWAATLVALALLFIVVRLAAYEWIALTAVALAAAGLMTAARDDARHEALAAAAAGLVVALLALWHLPAIVTHKAPLYRIAGEGYGSVPGPLLPPELLPFALACLGFAALFALAGYLALWGARRPLHWAWLSTGVPTALLIVAYWRLGHFEIDLAWAAIAMGLAGLALLAATQLARHREDPPFEEALGAFAAAVVGAITLAATMALRDFWLTVALAAQLPALAWLEARLRHAVLRPLAWLIALGVLLRLIFAFYFADLPKTPPSLFLTLLYGYGLPALAMLGAAKAFAVRRRDGLVLLLETGALIAAVVLVILEIRVAVHGSILALDYPLFERALDSLAWLAMAAGLEALRRGEKKAVHYWGARALAVLAGVQILFLQVLFGNPLWSGGAVGKLLFPNLLALAYLAPALVALPLARAFARGGETRNAAMAGAGALLLVFVFLSLEVRQLFHGTRLDIGATNDGELYAYSLVWLLYGGGLLALALRFESPALRYASLGIVLLTTCKAFLFDMAALTGVWRVFSFLGLGGALVAIGYFYQRLVFAPIARPEEAPKDAPGAEP